MVEMIDQIFFAVQAIHFCVWGFVEESHHQRKPDFIPFAEKSGVSRQTISSIETGKADNVLVSTLAAIAVALDTTVDKIFYPECPND